MGDRVGLSLDDIIKKDRISGGSKGGKPFRGAGRNFNEGGRRRNNSGRGGRGRGGGNRYGGGRIQKRFPR